MLDLEPAADQLAAVVYNISEEQLAWGTPLERTTVADLLAHVHGLAIAFRDAASKMSGPTTETPASADADTLPLDWRFSIRARLGELAQAWKDPQAWQGDTVAGGIPMPAEVTGSVANNELVLHAWDLAVATGQPFAVAGPNLEASWRFVESVPDVPDARAGLFGPRRPVAPDAPLLDRTLAWAGRDPLWTP